MGGPGSGTSMKRKAPAKHFAPGSLKRGDLRFRANRDAVGLLRQVQADMGGEGEMSALQALVAERLAFNAHRVVKMEAAAMAGETLDGPAYDAAVATLLRLADRLGYVRRARRVPSLAEYLRQDSAPSQPPGAPVQSDPVAAEAAEPGREGGQP
jgi:hypothetical protein